MEERLQKILSEWGIASRRKAEELIEEGRVTVNGHAARLGMKADPHKDHIKVNGKLIGMPQSRVYLMMNKPKGVVTSLFDPEGRPTIKDFLRGVKQRVYPVGRLDYDSEGLLILTNDGEFSHNLLHPSREMPKTYLVKVKSIIEDDSLNKLKKGIQLVGDSHREGILTAPAKVKKLKVTEQNSWIEITIYEGKKRQIRRMLEKVGHPVLKLKRIRIGSLSLGDLKAGEIRYLSAEEIKALKKLGGINDAR